MLREVKREALAACFTCPLCHKLLRQATTIIECLHTYEKSIHKKLLDEKMHCCPVCKTDLGCAPFDKLRPDHNLQDIRAKVFPHEMRKAKSLEVAAPVIALPTKRKKRSLSSLVVSSPRVSARSGITGRRTKFGTAQSFAKPETLHDDSEARHYKTRSKEHRQKPKVQYEKNDSDHSSSESERPRKLRRDRRSKAMNVGSKISPQLVFDAASAKSDQRNYPIWFSLVTSDEEGGDYPPLPQMSPNYIRIKDGNIPVSYIQKYLVAKLPLSSEEEVEIKCMGQTVIPTLTLNNLIDMWLQKIVTDRVLVTIGSSAKDFVMVLGYARKV